MLTVLLSVCLICGSALPSGGQTPVEEVIRKYENTKGARNFIASGGKMTVARKLLRATPVAPIASDVDALAVLKMENASENSRTMFEADLQQALNAYVYHGKQSVKKGIVDIYVFMSEQGTVSELVIYNPAIYSLNSLSGNFSAESLLELDVPEV